MDLTHQRLLVTPERVAVQPPSSAFKIVTPECCSQKKCESVKVPALAPAEEYGADSYERFKGELAAMRSDLREILLVQSELASTMSKVQDNLFQRQTSLFDSTDPPTLPAATTAGAVEEDTISELREKTLDHQKSTLWLLKTNAQLRHDHSMAKLNGLIAMNNQVDHRKILAARAAQDATICQRLRSLSTGTKDLLIDAFGCAIIISNTIFIGISADIWDGRINYFFFIDAAFAITFGFEFALRLNMHGFRGTFLGRAGLSNCFDALLCLLDTLQLLMVIIAKSATDDQNDMGLPSASLFRTVRLVRVTRILRLLRHPIFKDMLVMMEGTISGLRTLGGAMLMFVVMVFCVALICKELFGNDVSDADDSTVMYFNSVPRSMYTVFRCSFGDCSTRAGTPIPEHLNEAYGFDVSLCYGFLLFFVTIGFFNVVSAVFVDSTMSRALEETKQKQQERLADKELWATRVCIVIRRCLLKAGIIKEDNLKDFESSMLDMELPRAVVDDICKYDQEAMKALDDLDIDPDDHDKLSDILDPDHSGTVGFIELSQGLQSLRGQPRRSDIVVVDLMVRSMQEKIDDILAIVMENETTCEHLKETLAGRRVRIEGRLREMHMVRRPTNHTNGSVSAVSE